jgi:hypothetical protein
MGVLALAAPAVRAAAGIAVTTRELRCVSDQPFPVPVGTTAIPVPHGDFETAGKLPPDWGLWGGGIVAADDAPQGKAYCRLRAGKGGSLHTPPLRVTPGKPYFLSMWLKNSDEHWATITFTSEERVPSFINNYPGLPPTGNQWKQLGYYFWLPDPCTTIQFNIDPREDSAAGQFICVDDIRLRTATEAEMSAAYEAQRAQLPAYDIAPRPGDGKNLALSVAKWEGRAGIPGKPFVIWALGSSWTAAQGDGYGLMHAIRQRFPQAPTIIYKRHCGSGTPWEYAAGWVKQFVAVEQPDLVFTYTVGSAEGLDRMLTEVRRHTTADIIVPSIHFKPPCGLTPKDVENSPGQQWGQIREICRRHGVEFVENRRELAEYLQRAGLTPNDLLWDHVHQNLHGQMRVWDNVARHIAKPDRFDYAPESRERRIAVVTPVATATEQLSFWGGCGGWNAIGGAAQTGVAGARLKVRFVGNRIDVLGRRMPGGGSVKLFIDGIPAERAPVFATTFIQAKAATPKRPFVHNVQDCAPHAVDLGAKLVPQTWTITMTSDVGDYRLQGSVTGPDGEGNLARPFHSRSGQIGIDPRFWREGRVEIHGRPVVQRHGKPVVDFGVTAVPVVYENGQPVAYGDVQGDTFTFDVYRCARGTLSFRGAKPGPLAEPLVRSLPNGEHTLEIVAAGDGLVTIEGLYVFQPPEKGLAR